MSVDFQPQIDRLREAVRAQNLPGAVEGLLAYHVLGQDRHAAIEWNVHCTARWLSDVYNPGNIDCIAALGVSHYHAKVLGCQAELRAGLDRVIQRDAFSGDHLSLANNPSRLLGIALGARAVSHQSAQSWLLGILETLRQRNGEAADPLYAYVRYHVAGAAATLSRAANPSLYERCAHDWLLRQSCAVLTDTMLQSAANRDAILFLAATDLRFENAVQAAVIWTTINANLFLALSGVRQRPQHVAGVLSQFEPAMKRWRWDKTGEKQNAIRWPITGEREVQDILYLILRACFPDVVGEEHLKKFGHSGYIADFAIPALSLLIEVKYADAAGDFKKIEKEIQEDAIPYLQGHEHLIVFIYDASASVQEHALTIDALKKIPGVFDVIIACRPSQLDRAGKAY